MYVAVNSRRLGYQNFREDADQTPAHGIRDVDGVCGRVVTVNHHEVAHARVAMPVVVWPRPAGS